MVNNEPFFRMVKVYNDRVAAGQTGAWHTLVYESSKITNEEAQGRWFY